MPKPSIKDTVKWAEIVLPAADLQQNIDFFTRELGFRMDSIMPADNPRVARLSGHGLRVRLDSTFSGPPATLRLGVSGDETPPVHTAPNGVRIEFGPDTVPVDVPPPKPALVVSRLADNPDAWQTGRAGMQYRDLIPDRLGGYLIASHIRIPKGGPVPDNVHYHAVRFQMIYCCKGWVKLVYEDQGEPFVMHAGDCVLQPPLIRHRVLESSDGLEVIEIGCPAEHMTYLDHDMDLPTGRHLPERDYSGQQYTFYQADKAVWRPHDLPAFSASATGISEATRGLADANVLRNTGSVPDPDDLMIHSEALTFWFVLQGGLELRVDKQAGSTLNTGDAVVIPAGIGFTFTHRSDDLQLLEVTLSA